MVLLPSPPSRSCFGFETDDISQLKASLVGFSKSHEVFYKFLSQLNPGRGSASFFSGKVIGLVKF